MGKGGSFAANLVICIENVFPYFLVIYLCVRLPDVIHSAGTGISCSFMIGAEFLSGTV